MFVAGSLAIQRLTRTVASKINLERKVQEYLSQQKLFRCLFVKQVLSIRNVFLLNMIPGVIYIVSFWSYL